MGPRSKSDLIANTREDAISFLEDFEHLKVVLKKSETSPTDLRHASAILRRWLVEGLFQRVASPRVGRIEINAIDNKPIYRAAEKGDIHMFVSGGAQVHGTFIGAGIVNRGNRPARLGDYSPGRYISLTIESFRRQRVIYYEDQWFTRDEVVKFVANVAHGIHSGEARGKKEILLSSFRQTTFVTTGEYKGEKCTVINFDGDALSSQPNPRLYNPSEINGVLLEIISTVHLLTSSPSTIDLAAIIRTELSSAGSMPR